MPYVPFVDLYPELAKRETRSITVFPGSNRPVPPGEYGFIEMYCDEEGCDCRRVFFSVVSPGQADVLAVIAWGWEDLDFYARWMGDDDPRWLRDMKGPVLNLASPQSRHANALLELARDKLLSDPQYVDRIKRHYQLFRAKIQERFEKRKKHLGRKQSKTAQAAAARRAAWRRSGALGM